MVVEAGIIMETAAFGNMWRCRHTYGKQEIMEMVKTGTKKQAIINVRRGGNEPILCYTLGGGLKERALVLGALQALL